MRAMKYNKTREFFAFVIPSVLAFALSGVYTIVYYICLNPKNPVANFTESKCVSLRHSPKVQETGQTPSLRFAGQS